MFRTVELNKELNLPLVYPNERPPFKFGIDWNKDSDGVLINLVNALLSPLLLIRYRYVEGKEEGNSVGWTNLNFSKVDTEPQPLPNEILKKLSDTSFVVTWISPPLQSPGKFADEDFATIILSINDVGIISKENALLSGSVDGNGVLFNNAELYLSAKPLTKTNLSFWIVTPLTLLRASPKFLSGVFLINSIEIPSDTTLLFRIDLTIAISVIFCAVDLTMTSDNWVSLSSSIMSKVKSEVTFISFKKLE